MKYFMLLILIPQVIAAVGDKAKEECRRNAMDMIECKRILFGSRERIPADLLKYPHMVKVGTTSKDEVQWYCGGTLISPSWVLSAAHCMHDLTVPPPTLVRLGETSSEMEEEETLIQERRIVERISHPNYTIKEKYDDIALFKLDSPIEIGDIRIACLKIENTTDVSNFTVVGFGKTNYLSMAGTKTLMEVPVDLIPQDQCDKAMKKHIRNNSLKNGIIQSQICAGDLLKGGRDTCQGDSGGPLQVEVDKVDCVNSFPLPVLYGVTSFGAFCGYKNSPGVYTRVSSYIPWIESVVWPN